MQPSISERAPMEILEHDLFDKKVESMSYLMVPLENSSPQNDSLRWGSRKSFAKPRRTTTILKKLSVFKVEFFEKF